MIELRSYSDDFRRNLVLYICIDVPAGMAVNFKSPILIVQVQRPVQSGRSRVHRLCGRLKANQRFWFQYV